MESSEKIAITIFDTTLRDGELALTTKMSSQQKLELATLLAAMRVDVIEVGYPGAFPPDREAIALITSQLQSPIFCALASSQLAEVEQAAIALQFF
jgi:2-isopropylmalate synthase